MRVQRGQPQSEAQAEVTIRDPWPGCGDELVVADDAGR